MLRNLSDPPGEVNEGIFPLEKTFENDKEACGLNVLRKMGTDLTY
jgi:hypothetical protein